MDEELAGVPRIPRMAASRGRHWRDVLDPLTSHPLVGTLSGVALVVALVPLLYVWHGSDPKGPLYLSIPLFFLAPVLIASVAGGRRAGVLVAVVAVVIWDWFFIQPLYTVTVASPRDLLALLVFLVVALLVGQLSNLARRRTEEALQRARGSEALYDLSLALIARREPGDVLVTLTARLRATFGLEACAVLLSDRQPGGWRTAATAGIVPLDLSVERSRNIAATVSWVDESGRTTWVGQMAGTGLRDGRLVRPHVRQARAQFLPLRVGSRSVGVLELVHGSGGLEADRAHLLETFANGAALALEQARLASEEQAAVVARESDRLKSALLSSVSHDLRTPLAGIKAAASSLLQPDVQWSESDRRAFIQDIDHESDRLTRLVSNLLDLSRIEAGAIRADKEWEDIGELVDRVTHRLAPGLAGHPIRRDIPAGLPPVRLDAVQIEQALTNLLENAAKYSSVGAPIVVAAHLDGAAEAPTMRLSVGDQGVGIPRREQDKIFDTFYRVASTARGARGTGMGLAIVKGLVEANGGRITVASTPGRGSAFTVILPVERSGMDRLSNDAPLNDIPLDDPVAGREAR